MFKNCGNRNKNQILRAQTANLDSIKNLSRRIVIKECGVIGNTLWKQRRKSSWSRNQG